MPALKHIHTYERSPWDKETFRCSDPGCMHYLARKKLYGKYSRCKFCGETFILNAEALKRKDPRCLDCSNTKSARATRAAKDIMIEFVGGGGE